MGKNTKSSRKRRFTAENKWIRSKILARDGPHCFYCKKRDLHKRDRTVDHIIPRVRGGKTTLENCVIACKSCNTRKKHHIWDVKPRPNIDVFEHAWEKFQGICQECFRKMEETKLASLYYPHGIYDYTRVLLVCRKCKRALESQ